MPHDPYQALYIHLPFCKRRCIYCDFYTHAVDPDSPVISEYVDRILLDLRRKAKEGELGQIKTIYLGGGTPSFLGSKHLTKLLYTIGLSVNLTPQVEFTMEANPDSLTPELVRDVYALGVNRLSIGVQSFDDQLLSTLGRVHDSMRAKRAVADACERFDNVSIDLMCGIPGQTAEVFQDSISCGVDLGVSHVSIYPLTVEPHTPLHNMVVAGTLPDVDEDLEALMMAMGPNVLEPAGFHRYEVASYAKPGMECRHNIAYWTGVPYLGLGDSAATMTQNESRRMRVQDNHVTDDLDRRQMRAEDLMMKMRMTQGVSDQEVNEAALLLPGVLKVYHDLVADGLVEHVDGRFKPTFSGWLLGNELYGRIFELAP